jgi:hypothetical protein
MSKPRSLITSTAPLARSMSIPARGARNRKREPPSPLPLHLLPAATSRAGAARRRRGRRAQQTDAPLRAEEGGGAGRRAWCRASAAADAAAAMAPRRAVRVRATGELPGGERLVGVRGPDRRARSWAGPCRVQAPRAGAWFLSGWGGREAACSDYGDKVLRRAVRRAGARPPLPDSLSTALPPTSPSPPPTHPHHQLSCLLLASTLPSLALLVQFCTLRFQAF